MLEIPLIGNGHFHLKLEGNSPLQPTTSRAPNIDCYVPGIWPRSLTSMHDLDLDLWPWLHHKVYGLKQWRVLAFDLDLWHTTLTFIRSLAKSQGNRSNSSVVRTQTDKWTDSWTDATKCIISPLRKATQSIKIKVKWFSCESADTHDL